MSAPFETSAHPTAMDFDRALLGLLPEDRQRALDEHVRGCARCAETQQTLQSRAAHFRAEVAPRTLPRVLAAADGPAARLSRWWSTAGAGRRWAWLATPVVAAGLVLAVGTVGPKGRRASVVDQEPDVSTKGRPALRTFVRRGERVFAATSGEALAPGDAVRFVVEPRGHRYLLVVSVDGAGKVSVYHPFEGALSAPLGTDPRVELPGSIVLDRAPGPERVFALFSDAPLSAAAARESLERIAAGGPERIRRAHELPLPGTEQDSFLFEKVEPR
jgi:hypothetical protein